MGSVRQSARIRTEIHGNTVIATVLTHGKPNGRLAFTQEEWAFWQSLLHPMASLLRLGGAEAILEVQPAAPAERVMA